MFTDHFSHYLSYGASDQETVRQLRDHYDGLLVPGTVAAFQKDGTGGFVLSLSATASAIPYVIDPRFPLFQQRIDTPKKSHEALATILGLPESQKARDPVAEWFTAEKVERIAECWAKFNCGYQGAHAAKFSKYAKRLGENLNVAQSSAPLLVLAPYVVATSDAWWKLSCELYAATKRHVTKLAPKMDTVQVVAGESPADLVRLFRMVQSPVAIWVSDLNELRAEREEDIARLIDYGRAIAAGRQQKLQTFALYGGFFSVALGNFGLGGSSHGIGYGESRAWQELPQSGPPPARYYVPELHRYVSVEIAYNLWRAEVSRCDCPACASQAPIYLKYHDLMKHSVYCRENEIAEWPTLGGAQAANRLEAETKEFHEKLRQAALPDVQKANAREVAAHLPGWVKALRAIAG